MDCGLVPRHGAHLVKLMNLVNCYGMARDYGQAAVRHYKDAETLASTGTLDSAGHMIGLSAECSLKKSRWRVHAAPEFGNRGSFASGEAEHQINSTRQKRIGTAFAVSHRFLLLRALAH